MVFWWHCLSILFWMVDIGWYMLSGEEMKGCFFCVFLLYRDELSNHVVVMFLGKLLS